jgi:hypothetical protein
MDACLGLFAMQIGAGVFFALELQKNDRTNNFQGNFMGSPLIQVMLVQFKQVLNHISIF